MPGEDLNSADVLDGDIYDKYKEDLYGLRCSLRINDATEIVRGVMEKFSINAVG